MESTLQKPAFAPGRSENVAYWLVTGILPVGLGRRESTICAAPD